MPNYIDYARQRFDESGHPDLIYTLIAMCDEESLDGFMTQGDIYEDPEVFRTVFDQTLNNLIDKERKQNGGSK